MANPKLIPLRQWYCDNCNELIEKPEEGYLEWRDDRPKDNRKYGFRIVHHALYSPKRRSGSDCYYKQSERGGDLDLLSFLGPTGLAHLTAWLDYGQEYEKNYSNSSRRVESLREWVELVRRLHVPYYEEARMYFQQAFREYGDSAPEYFYVPDRLRSYIDEFSEAGE
jgi:hypothetical protein